MIKEITILGTATFKVQQKLSDLSCINFFYGANGSGKTTISRIIANESKYPDCHINWQGDTKMKTFVYNRDFIDDNLDLSSEIKGIFTLGKSNKDIIRQIKDSQNALDKLDSERCKLQSTLSGEDGTQGKNAELSELETNFVDKSWKFKLKYDTCFQEAFSGLRADRQRFANRLEVESQSNTSELCDFENLQKRASTIYGNAPKKENQIPPIKYNELLSLETHQILLKKVIGSGDVDIAALIGKLKNDDWVKDGREYLYESEGVCPFCQQQLPEPFKKKLAEYFEETYEKDIGAIQQLCHDYDVRTQSITDYIQNIIKLENQFIEYRDLKATQTAITGHIRNNKQILSNKKREPSKSVSLEPLVRFLKDISTQIAEVNEKAKNHNALIDNLANEKQALTNQIWQFIVNEAKDDYVSYSNDKTNIQKAISSLSKSIKEKEKDREKELTKISTLEKSITSIQPTIDDINHLLRSYGFTGFSLSASDQKSYYKILREDGTDARKTLSEGEKTFITFLYFYHLLRGSETERGIVENRIVVFDDPISSLDSNILFIVSNLIKILFKEIRTGTNDIKQVFVLTHNVYFHKEVTYNKKRHPQDQIQKDETFWIVRKVNSMTQVLTQTKNPIKTSYQLLWKEINSPDMPCLTIQNTLRRILEHYFKISGNMNIENIINKFVGKDKVLCHSLLSWVNDGSHNADDDLCFTTDEDSVKKFLDIFREIFYKLGHEAHYNMMMGIAVD